MLIFEQCYGTSQITVKTQSILAAVRYDNLLYEEAVRCYYRIGCIDLTPANFEKYDSLLETAGVNTRKIAIQSVHHAPSDPIP